MIKKFSIKKITILISLIILVIVLSIIMIRKTYQYNLYNSKTKYTEGLVAKYDMFGNLKQLDYYNIYGEMKDESICEEFNKNKENYIDLKYKDVKCSCSINDLGVEVHYYMTNKSVKSGYITNKEDYYFIFKNIYNYVKDEKLAKDYFNKKIDKAKNNDSLNNENTYFIINNKKENK